jgi:hypothetical protein
VTDAGVRRSTGVPRHLLPALVVAAALIPPAPAAASCAFLSSADQEQRADIVAEGTILEAEFGRARLAVERRIKGDPPDVLVVTGGSGPGVMSGEDILPRPGERWRILGQDDGPATVWTSICEGSVRLDEPAPATGLAALLGWLGALLGSG